MGVRFATREQFMALPDIKASAYAYARVDDCLEGSARDIERHLHWTNIHPLIATRYWDYPNDQDAFSGRLWLDDSPLLSLTSFTSGGTTVPSANYVLEPNRTGPPYRSVNIQRLSTSALAAGSTSGQRALALTGTWGVGQDEVQAGTLGAAISTTSATTFTATSFTEVGSLLRVDDERMLVTNKAFVTSSQTGTLAASNAAVTLAVSDGSVFVRGEELIIDAERLMVEEITGNTLIVKRAYSGSVLAAHTTAAVYWPRSITVTRGEAGTTAATHLINAPVYRWLPPATITELNLAWALDRFFQGGSGYARTIGQGENERTFTGRGIALLAEDVKARYGRNLRFRSV